MPKLDKLKCPNCGHRIPIDEILSHDIAERTREEMRAEVVSMQEDMTKREKALVDREKVNEQTIAARVKLAAQTARQEEEQRARDAVAAEMQSLQIRHVDHVEALRAAQAVELKLRNENTKLEERAATLDLEVARKIAEERTRLISEVTERLDGERRLKDAEKDKQLTDALDTVQTLQRKLEQGSQQLQGEILELEVEATLKATFTFDTIEPVPKGVTGADVIQRVCPFPGVIAGSIVWELKRTKSFKDEWITKLKGDMRVCKADIAVIITQTMPDGIDHCAFLDGVWVTSIEYAMVMASLLRMQIIEVANARTLQKGKKNKMEAMYDYLAGPHFRQRVEAIIEAFTEMQADIAEERRVSERRWAKREKQVAQVITGTAGMYGDLQGLVGLSNIPQLEHKS